MHDCMNITLLTNYYNKIAWDDWLNWNLGPTGTTLQISTASSILMVMGKALILSDNMKTKHSLSVFYGWQVRCTSTRGI